MALARSHSFPCGVPPYWARASTFHMAVSGTCCVCHSGHTTLLLGCRSCCLGHLVGPVGKGGFPLSFSGFDSLRRVCFSLSQMGRVDQNLFGGFSESHLTSTGLKVNRLVRVQQRLQVNITQTLPEQRTLQHHQVGSHLLLSLSSIFFRMIPITMAAVYLSVVIKDWSLTL